MQRLAHHWEKPVHRQQYWYIMHLLYSGPWPCTWYCEATTIRHWCYGNVINNTATTTQCNQYSINNKRSATITYHQSIAQKWHWQHDKNKNTWSQWHGKSANGKRRIVNSRIATKRRGETATQRANTLLTTYGKRINSTVAITFPKS